MLIRRVALLGLLAGCGLTPVYGPNGEAQVLQNATSVKVPDTVAGFRLRERLTERFGPATLDRYDLTVTIDATLSPATISEDGVTTRFNLTGEAQYTLTTPDGMAVTAGTVNTFMGYSATGSTVATQAAATDAQARLSVALADLIAARLVLYVRQAAS